MSSWLFYGPSAYEAALTQAKKTGFLFRPFFGESGLKVEEARQAVERINMNPPGDQLGVVLIGPMDEASSQASDVLLKSLEEFPSRIQPILWAKDISSVIPTIRSRCLLFWSFSSEISHPEEVISECFDFLKNQTNIPFLISFFKKKKNLSEFLEVLPWVLLQENFSVGNVKFWISLRKLLEKKNLTSNEVLSFFLTLSVKRV